MSDLTLTIRKTGYSRSPWRFFLDDNEVQIESERVDLPGAPPTMGVSGYDTKAAAVDALCRVFVRLVQSRPVAADLPDGSEGP